MHELTAAQEKSTSDIMDNIRQSWSGLNITHQQYI